MTIQREVLDMKLFIRLMQAVHYAGKNIKVVCVCVCVCVRVCVCVCVIWIGRDIEWVILKMVDS